MRKPFLFPRIGTTSRWKALTRKTFEITKDDTVFRLPSIVFASNSEGEVGLVHRAVPTPIGPQPTWDPDVVAGLDDGFDYEDPDNQLDDDFMQVACQEPSDAEHSDADSSYCDSNYAESGDEFSDEETKSRFTAYSMTSSVIRRNDQLSMLDDRFEKFFESYDDKNIGDLCQVDIGGGIPVDDIGEVGQMLLG
uniref:Protein LTV1 homolog n=1 Tax=Ciona savignyi TaxID=51511 RepID=H2Y666_CIOSA